MKQSDKLTAYYFRAAQQIDTLYLATKIKHIAKKLNLDNKCFQQL